MNSKLAGMISINPFHNCINRIWFMFALVCFLFLSFNFTQQHEIQIKYKILKQERIKHVRHIYPRSLVSFRKQRIHFPESLQGHLMLCGINFNYISSRLLLIASSNSTSAFKNRTLKQGRQLTMCCLWFYQHISFQEAESEWRNVQCNRVLQCNLSLLKYENLDMTPSQLYTCT